MQMRGKESTLQKIKTMAPACRDAKILRLTRKECADGRYVIDITYWYG